MRAVLEYFRERPVLAVFAGFAVLACVVALFSGGNDAKQSESVKTAAKTAAPVADTAGRLPQVVQTGSSAAAIMDPALVGNWSVPLITPYGHAEIVFDITSQGQFLSGVTLGDYPVVTGRFEAAGGRWSLKMDNGDVDGGTYQLEGPVPVVTGMKGIARWIRKADTSRQGALFEQGIDPKAARVLQLRAIAETAARRWRPEAKLVEIEIKQLNNDGSLNLFQSSGKVKFVFLDGKAGRGAIVTFDHWGGPQLLAPGRPVSRAKEPLGKRLVDLTEVVRVVREQGYETVLRSATLRHYQKKNRKARPAWKVQGHMQSVDRSYRYDAQDKHVLLPQEIDPHRRRSGAVENLEGAQRWLERSGEYGRFRANPTGSITMKGKGEGNDTIIADRFFYWLVRVIEVRTPGRAEPWEVLIPIRSYDDSEFDAMIEVEPLTGFIFKEVEKSNTRLGNQLIPPNAEQRRVFKDRLGEKMLNVNVPPFIVYVEKLEKQKQSVRNQIREAVETLYHRTGQRTSNRFPSSRR